jgi:hypothetical protein
MSSRRCSSDHNDLIAKEPVTVTEPQGLDLAGKCPSCGFSWKGYDKETGVYSLTLGVFVANRIPQVSHCCPHCHKEFDRETKAEVPTAFTQDIMTDLLVEHM